MFLVAFLYMIMASTFTIGKIVLGYFSPIFFIGFRMTLCGSLLLIYYRFICKKTITIKKEFFWIFAAIIVFHIYFSFVAEFWSLRFMLSSQASLFYNLSPFISAIFSYFLFSEKMTLKKLFALIIVFVGFLFAFLMSGETPFGTNLLGFISLPEMVMLFSVISAAYGWILVRKMLHEGYSIIMINGLAMIGGGLLALVTSLLVETSPLVKPLSAFKGTDWSTAIGYTVTLIIIANFIFYNLYGFLLRRYTVTLLTLAGAATPLFTMAFGMLFLGERVTYHFFVSLLFFFIGMYLFYKEELRQGYIFHQ